MKPSFRKSYIAAAAAIVIVSLAAVFVYWRATAALRTERRAAESARTLKFVSRPLAPAIDSGFEWLSAPAQFREAAEFKGDLYIAASAGLTAYDGQGHALREFRVGRELPSAPLTRAIAATLPGARKPELIVGTAGAGVIAFDGTSLRQVLPERREARDVTALLVLASGQLLIGTQKAGVLSYDGAELKPFHATLANVPVTELAGSDSDLWVGTADRGVAHFHGGTTDWFSETNGLPDAHVYAISVAGDRAFVGTATGIAEFSGGQFVRVLAPGAFVRSLLVRGTSLLAGTMDDGVIAIPLNTNARNKHGEHERFADLREVQQLFAAGDSVVGVSDAAVYVRSERGGWQKLITPGERLLSDGNISALAMDRSGKLWVGYFDRGIDIVDLATQRARHIEDDRVFCVNRVLPSAFRGGTAVATANGLVLFDDSGERRQVLGRNDGLIAEHVTDIVPFHDGLAVATPAGLTFLDSGGARSVYAFHGLVNNHVYALVANGNQLLAGTLGGATMLDGDQVRVSYTTATSALRHNWITAAVRVSDGFWIGTYGAGMVFMNDLGHFQAADGAAGDLIVNPGAVVAGERIVAAGTLGRGLYVMERTSGRWRAIVDGVPSLNVTALTIANGYLYVGTDNGLVRIAEQRLVR
jgi:ligand-binding sensor domain-containing protein